MHFKIIETSTQLPDVLLHRDRDENGQEMVKILAVGKIGEDENMFAIEQIEFENVESAISFIRDYSKTSAEKWCQKQEVAYW